MAKHLPDLNVKQIQKATYSLLQQDRIRKQGKVPRIGNIGRPTFLYVCREDYEPISEEQKTEKVTPKRKLKINKRPDHREYLRSPSGTEKFLGTIKFRDRKVRLIQELIPKHSDTAKDLLIGMLSDYGGKI